MSKVPLDKSRAKQGPGYEDWGDFFGLLSTLVDNVDSSTSYYSICNATFARGVFFGILSTLVRKSDSGTTLYMKTGGFFRFLSNLVRHLLLSQLAEQTSLCSARDKPVSEKLEKKIIKWSIFYASPYNAAI